MTDNELNRLKKKLDKLVETKADYSEIYMVSQEIDKLILKHYSKECNISDVKKT